MLIGAAYFCNIAVAGCLNVLVHIDTLIYEEIEFPPKFPIRNRDANPVGVGRTSYACGLFRFPWSF